MPRKPTIPWNMRVYCAVYRDADFISLTCTAQALAFRSISRLGLLCSEGGAVMRPADLAVDEYTFNAVGRELVRVGIWTWVDDNAVEVWPYKDLIVLDRRRWRPRIDPKTRRELLERDGKACRRCGATDRLELDHIYPYSLGGPTVEDNLQVLCRPCNQAKGARV